MIKSKKINFFINAIYNYLSKISKRGVGLVGFLLLPKGIQFYL